MRESAGHAERLEEHAHLGERQTTAAHLIRTDEILTVEDHILGELTFLKRTEDRLTVEDHLLGELTFRRQRFVRELPLLCGRARHKYLRRQAQGCIGTVARRHRT